MKKIIFIFLIYLMFFSTQLLKTYAQVNPYHVFLVHGFRADPSWMDGFTDYIYNNYQRTFGLNRGSEPTWYSTTDLTYSAVSIYSTLNPTTTLNYIGIGHSAGGLLTRDISHYQGNVQNNPSPFMRGYITVGTPNQGALFALSSNSSQFVFSWASSRTEIWRAPTGFLGWLGGSVLNAIFDVSLVFVDDILTIWLISVKDMQPNSYYLNNLNNITNQSYEASMPNGFAAIFGEWYDYKYPAFWCGSMTPSDSRKAYIDNINTWQAANNNFANAAARDQSKARWYRPWYYASAAWNRMRAGDYGAAVRGLKEVDYAWTHYTSNYQPSDAFIPVSSQIGIPNIGNQYVRIGPNNVEISHNEEVTASYWQLRALDAAFLNIKIRP